MTTHRAYVVVLACQLLAAVATVASLRWLAVYVDPETFGRYALYQSVVSAGALLVISWPNAALLRFGREEWSAHGRVGTTLAARLLLFGICLLFAWALAWLLDRSLQRFLHSARSPFWWFALGLAVAPATEMAVYVHQTIGRTEMYGYTPLITRAGFFMAVLLIPVLGTGHDWTYLALALAVSGGAAGTYAVCTLPSSCWSQFRLQSRTLADVLRYSWVLPFAGISTYVVNWIDSWVIRGVKGVGPVGIYNWAYQTTAIATLAFAPIAVVLTPRMIDARVTGDRAGIKRYVDAIVPTAALASVATALGLAFVHPVVQWVAAPSYAPAYPVILILLSALPFQLIAYLVTPLGNAYERVLPRFVLVSIVIAALNSVGDVLLVPRLGISGAAISTAFAFGVGAVLQVAVVRQIGIAFAPLWRYAIPAFILVPALAILHGAGPARGGLMIAAFAGMGLVVAAFYGSSKTGRMNPIQRIIALASALALAGSVAEQARAE